MIDLLGTPEERADAETEIMEAPGVRRAETCGEHAETCSLIGELSALRKADEGRMDRIERQLADIYGEIKAVRKELADQATTAAVLQNEVRHVAGTTAAVVAAVVGIVTSVAGTLIITVMLKHN